MRTLLVTGAAGQTGRELLRLPWPADVRLLAPSRSELDITCPDAVHSYVLAQRPSGIVNLAAYTAVDRAEDEIASAYAVNAFGPAALAAAARQVGAALVHVSTDYVFGFGVGRLRLPADEPAPTTVYGASKLAGEIAVRAACNRSVIVRTAWLVSPFGSNFLKTMLRLASERDEISVVADQRGCPTAAGDLAAVLQRIVLRLMEEPSAPTGTYHFVNEGEATWAELAAFIMAEAGRAGLPTARIKPVTSAEYPARAARPSDSRLSTETLLGEYGLSNRPWREAVSAIIHQIANNQSRTLEL